MHSYVQFLKDIFTTKRRLEEFEIVCLTKECNTILTGEILEKMKDIGSFTILVAIEGQKLGKHFAILAQALI